MAVFDSTQATLAFQHLMDSRPVPGAAGEVKSEFNGKRGLGLTSVMIFTLQLQEMICIEL